VVPLVTPEPYLKAAHSYHSREIGGYQREPGPHIFPERCQRLAIWLQGSCPLASPPTDGRSEQIVP
jgi:hypothetical protein